jgi:DNA-directed RNA polymerase sigma subunit (sigma70/sigma32)
MMPQQQIEESLPETRRKEIFMALVRTQDKRVGVARSRQVVAGEFGVSVEQIRQIEEEGLDGEWPPL